MKKNMKIAIDGTGSSGKGTLAKKAAAQLSFSYIDTGAIYRSVAYLSRRAGISWEDGEQVAQLAQSLSVEFIFEQSRFEIKVNDEVLTNELRQEDIGQGASIVSSHPSVRAALVEIQRSAADLMDKKQGGVLMDGRDIGSVILPEADLKIYVDAQSTVRAKRRFNQLIDGHDAPSLTYEDVLSDLMERDLRDKTRSTAPLVQCSDAVLLDTTDLTIEQSVQQIVDWVQGHEAFEG